MEFKEIMEAAKERLGIEALTEMQQAMADPKAASVMLIAPTGSGKTLAFALPMLRRINPEREGVQAVVIAPSRELVMQIARVVSALAPRLRVAALYGGHSMPDEVRSLQAQTPAVAVGTPGRLLDHIRRGTLSVRTVPTLVLDEFDKSLELGFADEMKRIVKAMARVQFTILTSATKLDPLPDFLHIGQPKLFDFSSRSEAAPQLKIKEVWSTEADKLDTLARLLDSVPRRRAIIFVNHRESAERVYKSLIERRFPAALYHGALDQQERETAIDLFTNGTSPILVATDLAARGLDIPQVESVIHYHLPTSPEAWTHRCGRAGRMGAEGTVYVILGPQEQVPDYVTDAEPYRPTPLPDPWRRTLMSLYFHAGRKEKLSRGDIAGALMQVAALPREDVGVITVHDHRALAAVAAGHAAAAMSALNSGKIKGRRIRVTLVK